MSISAELGLESAMQDVHHEAVLNIVRTATLLSQLGTVLFREFGLTEAQFNVLFSLKFKQTEWTQSDLGKRLVVTRASITSVLDKLEEKGLVQREAVPNNRRIYHVNLTDAGRALVDEVEPRYRAAIHALLADFGEEDCRTLVHQLERVRERVLQREVTT